MSSNTTLISVSKAPTLSGRRLGPALEAYSAHPYVKKTAGGMMTVEEFLREVSRLVLAIQPR